MSAIEKKESSSTTVAMLQTSITTEDIAQPPIQIQRNHSRLMLGALSPLLKAVVRLVDHPHESNAPARTSSDPLSTQEFNQLVASFSVLMKEEAKLDQTINEQFEEVKEFVSDLLQQLEAVGDDLKQLSSTLKNGFSQLAALLQRMPPNSLPSLVQTLKQSLQQEIDGMTKKSAAAPSNAPAPSDGSAPSQANYFQAVLQMVSALMDLTVSMSNTAATSSEDQSNSMTKLQEALVNLMAEQLNNTYQQLEDRREAENRIHWGRIGMYIMMAVMVAGALASGNFVAAVMLGTVMALQMSGAMDKAVNGIANLIGNDSQWLQGVIKVVLIVVITTIAAVASGGMSLALEAEEIAVQAAKQAAKQMVKIMIPMLLSTLDPVTNFMNAAFGEDSKMAMWFSLAINIIIAIASMGMMYSSAGESSTQERLLKNALGSMAESAGKTISATSELAYTALQKVFNFITNPIFFAVVGITASADTATWNLLASNSYKKLSDAQKEQGPIEASIRAAELLLQRLQQLLQQIAESLSSMIRSVTSSENVTQVTNQAQFAAHALA